MLLAANFGGDADTTAAITGQLAGALYGLSAIPADWLAKLAWRERIMCWVRSCFSYLWWYPTNMTGNAWTPWDAGLRKAFICTRVQRRPQP